jgi:hypothetical protein
VVLFHRPAQLAPHPRAALDAGHGSKVTDVTAVAYDQPGTNCFVASWQKTITGFIQATEADVGSSRMSAKGQKRTHRSATYLFRLLYAQQDGPGTT